MIDLIDYIRINESLNPENLEWKLDVYFTYDSDDYDKFALLARNCKARGAYSIDDLMSMIDPSDSKWRHLVRFMHDDVLNHIEEEDFIYLYKGIIDAVCALKGGENSILRRGTGQEGIDDGL